MRSVVDDRYAILAPLGDGAMGRVYLAREVALKVLREKYARTREFVGRFEREAKATASLNHFHIASVYDRDQTEKGTSPRRMTWKKRTSRAR